MNGNNLDSGPYVCPGCHAVGPEECALDCIDDEIRREAEDARGCHDDDDIEDDEEVDLDWLPAEKFISPSEDFALKADPLLSELQGRCVVEDMMRESEAFLPRRVSAAHFAWVRNANPSDAELGRTLFVIDASTTLESYCDGADVRYCEPDWKVSGALRMEERAGSWKFWFSRAREVLRMHPFASRARVVRPHGQYRPEPGEVVLVQRKKPGSRQLFVAEFCRVEGCDHGHGSLFAQMGVAS